MTTTPTPGAEMRLPFTREDALAELRRRYPSAFDGSDPLDEQIGLKVKNASDWVLAFVLAAAPVAPVGEDGELAFGPETEAMIERDGHFFVLSWVKRGREFSARIYEPQMMRASPAIADALLMAFEAGSDAEKADIALAARAQPPTGEAVERTAAREVMDLIASNDPVIRVLKDRGASEGLIDGVAYALIWDRKQRAAHPTEPAARDGGEAERHDCPICLNEFKPDDMCGDDIDMGICHAACLEGATVVNLETGEPSDGPVLTYRYDSLSSPPASGQAG